MPSSAQLDEPAHTDECNALMAKQTFGIPSMERLRAEGRAVVFACPHPSHDTAKYLWGAKP
jgi:hypothetical protein